MTTSITFGEWLRQARRARDLSRADLAHKVGCASDTLRKMEGNLRRPSKSMLARLLTVLAVAPTERTQIERLARSAALPEAADPPSPGPITTTTRLPRALNRLIGREHDLEQVSVLLRLSDMRLLTLIGPAGTGKTRLAQELAERLVRVFDDGVLWLSLADVSEAAFVTTALCHLLGLGGLDHKEQFEHLTTALRNRHLLLVIDNCEHVLEAMPTIGALLEQLPLLKVLATSREPLRLYGETRYQLAPLALPPHNPNTSWSLVCTSPAVQLLLERMQGADPGYSPLPQHAPFLIQLCYDLDGNPLALELAAAQTSWLSLEHIQAELRRLLPQLRVDLRDRTSRQTSLWGTLDWSYALLPPALQQLLARLSMFQGGWTVEAARIVCSDGSSDVQMLAACRVLAEKHLVQYDRNAKPPRFQQTFVLREYARAQLTHDEAILLAERHAEYYCTLAEQANNQILSNRRAEAIEQLEREYTNLRASIQWSLAHNPVLAARLCQALGTLWSESSFGPEGREWVRALLSQSGQLPSATLANIRLLQGLLGPPGQATDSLGESLAFYQAVGDRDSAARVRTALGGQALCLGDYTLAHHHWQAALDHWLTTTRTDRIVVALNNMAALALVYGQGYDAEHWLQAALNIHRRQISGLESLILSNLSSALYQQARYTEAGQAAQQAISAATQEQRPRMGAQAVFVLAQIAWAAADATQALRYLCNALEVLSQRKLWGDCCPCIDLAAAITATQGTPEQAAHLLAAADALYEREHLVRQPVDQLVIEPVTQLLRQRLSPGVLEQLQHEARALLPDQIIILVLASRHRSTN